MTAGLMSSVSGGLAGSAAGRNSTMSPSTSSSAPGWAAAGGVTWVKTRMPEEA
ncbi:MAG: hypothetical protein ACK6D7_27450 [Acidobacteriota bacterium]